MMCYTYRVSILIGLLLDVVDLVMRVNLTPPTPPPNHHQSTTLSYTHTHTHTQHTHTHTHTQPHTHTHSHTHTHTHTRHHQTTRKRPLNCQPDTAKPPPIHHPVKKQKKQRAHFEAWITQCEAEGKPLTSPMTRQPVSPIWFPNRSIRQRVEEYLLNLKGDA